MVMSIKITASLIASLLMVSCSGSVDAPADKSNAVGVGIDAPENDDVPRDSTPINENNSITTTTRADGAAEEGYGTSQLTDVLLKIGLVTYMEASAAAYAANELTETDTFEGLDRYLSDSAEAWVDGVAAATSKGVLPVDAIFTVDGTDFRELTSSTIKPADGISLDLALRKVTCTMVGTFYEKADLNMGFTWAAPTCTE